jgi:hypothetical protein
MKSVFLKIFKAFILVAGYSALMGPTAIANESPLLAVTSEQDNSFTPSSEPTSTIDPNAAQLLQQIQRFKGVKQGQKFLATDRGNSMAQVTNVSELRDVQPSSWAYEALQSLVERYGCVVGYPDRTFRGDRALSRWEFAAGLNACMGTMERLIQENVAVVRADLDKLKRLAQDFEAELGALGTRVDNLETRVAYLEDHQFSTTTKLFGVSTLYVAGTAGDKTAASYIPSVNGVKEIRPSQELANQTVMQYSTLLSLNTSFNGKDNLSVDLWTSNVTPFSGPIFGFTPNVTGTYQSRLSFDAPPYNNQLQIADLIYKFQPLDNLSVFVDALGGEVSGELLYSTQPFTVFAPYTTSISRFGRFDPIYYQTLARPGVGANYKFSDQFAFGAGFYGDFNASNPEQGFFGGGNAAIAQFSLFPTDSLGMTLTYVRSYNQAGRFVNVSGQTGSLYADQPFGTAIVPASPSLSATIPVSIATAADHLSWGFGWRPMETLVVSQVVIDG